MKLTTSNTEQVQRKIGECVNDVLNITSIRRATAYISEKLVIKATAQCRIRKRDGSATVLVTVGTPNFAERRFIGVCKKQGMAFPLNTIYHKPWPKKK